MLKRIPRFLAALAAAAVLGGNAAVAATAVTALRGECEAKLADIDRDQAAAVVQWRASYRSAVETEAKKMQDAGDFAGLMAVLEEGGRFDEAQSVPDVTPADAHAAVKLLQNRYRLGVAEAGLKKQEAVAAAFEAYLKRLVELKRQLTMRGDLDGAMAAHTEIGAVQNDPRFLEAKAAVARSGAAPQSDTTALATGSGAATGAMTTCPRCGGTGKARVACPDCGGSGYCDACNGTGRREAQLKGSRSRPICLKCRGSGRCSTCGGSGYVEIECSACGGRGSVPREVAVTIKPPAALPTPLPPPATATAGSGPKRVSPSVSSSATSGAIDAYRESVQTLLDKFQTEQPETANYSLVARNPAGYVGRLLQSTVYLTLGHPRSIRVVAQSSQKNSEGDVMLPYDLDVGLAAEKIYREKGVGAKVVVTYGVVNKDNLTVFDVSAADL